MPENGQLTSPSKTDSKWSLYCEDVSVQSPTMEMVKYSGSGSGVGVGVGVGLGVGVGVGVGLGVAETSGVGLGVGSGAAVTRKNSSPPSAATAIMNIKMSVNFFAVFIALLRPKKRLECSRYPA